MKIHYEHKGWCCAVRIGCVVIALMPTIFAGCMQTVPPEPTGTQYLDPGIVVSASPGSPTMYDLERLANQMMEKLNTCAPFMENYNSVKAKKKGNMPRLVVAYLDNNTTSHEVPTRLNAVRDSINEWLYNSGLFTIKNDDNSLVLARGILDEVTGSTKSPNKNIDADSLDFYLCGDLRNIPDGVGVHQYRLRITMYNLHTGDVLWEGTQRILKQ